MSDETNTPSTPPEPSTPPAATPHAIPGMRAMAVVRWLLLAAVASVAAASWWTLVLHGEAPSAGPARYYCPMHPQITSAEPGTCPICHMTLEPIPTERGAGAPAEAPDAAVAETPPAPGERPTGTTPVMLTTERRQSSGLTLASVRRVDVDGTLRWPAVIEARDGARGEVRVRSAAFVERVAVHETGVRVRRGQVLAWVYSPEVLRAEEELLAAHRWPAGTAGASAAPEAAARARLELLGASAADIDGILAAGTASRTLPLRAPVGGLVTRFDAVVGAYAGPERVLYEIVDYAQLRVVASVLDPAEVALAASADAVFARREGGEPIALALELIEPATDTSARATRVRFLLPNADGALRSGEIGEVVAHVAGRSALVVPRDAVIDRGLVQYVFVDRGGGLFEPRVVRAGALEGEEREILEGLREGEHVVSRGAFVLDSESRLEAALAPSPGGEVGAGAGMAPGMDPAMDMGAHP